MGSPLRGEGGRRCPGARSRGTLTAYSGPPRQQEEDTTPAPYATIACFVDQDPGSDAALAEAVSLRALSPGELQVVHVAPRPLMLMPRPYGGAPTPAELATAGRAWLEERVRGLPQATPVLLEGDPPHAACEHAAAAGVDLIVAAAHRGIVDRAMLGGFASYVAYHAPCPVLLVHPPPVGVPGAG